MTEFLLHLAGIVSAGVLWLVLLLNIAGMPFDVLDWWKELRK